MFRKALVALDGSPGAECSLPWGRLVAHNAVFAFLRVIRIPVLRALPEQEEQKKGLVQKYLSDLARKSGMDPAVLVRHGSPAETILETAKEFGADLIAVTTHGRTSLGRRLFGGTTEQLLHSADLPLLVVPSAKGRLPVPPAIRRILVPLDGSEAAAQVIPLARDTAKEIGAELLLFNSEVTEPTLEEVFAEHSIEELEKDPYFQMLKNSLKEETDRDQARIHSWAEDVKREGVTCRAVFGSGKLPGTIVGAVQSEKADLIVMAGHGYGVVRRIILGSVASRLIADSSVPIVVVRRGALDKLGTGSGASAAGGAS